MATFAEQLAEYTAWAQFQEKTPEAFEEHQALLLTDKRVRYILDPEVQGYLSLGDVIAVLSGQCDNIVNEHFATTKGIEE